MPLPESLSASMRLPVIGAPMFLVSGAELVIAQCKAGVLGTFPVLNARPQEELDKWLVRIETELAEFRRLNPGAKVPPFGVNLIVNPANKRLEQDLEVVVRHKVPLVITSLSAPREIARRVHEYGGTVLHDVIKVRHAEKALEAGVDGLILVCAGAGGHAGTTSPFALVSEVRRFFNGPLALSGCITSGSGILAAQAMGCDAAYIGTRFIATRESAAPDEYKQMIVGSGSADIVYTSLFSGVHGSYLGPSIRAAGLDPEDLPVPTAEERGKYRGRDGRPLAWKSVWGAGQGVGSIDSIVPVLELVDGFEREYLAARRALAG